MDFSSGNFTYLMHVFCIHLSGGSSLLAEGLCLRMKLGDSQASHGRVARESVGLCTPLARRRRKILYYLCQRLRG